jgi:hypothetical protein
MNGRGSANGQFANAPSPAKVAEARATTGVAAVQQSKRAREQQDMMRIDKDSPSAAVKNVGGKTFYLREGVWTDSEFQPSASLPETVVKFSSDEYFALLKQKPQLSTFFSLGERVIVILDGRIYRVNAAN